MLYLINRSLIIIYVSYIWFQSRNFLYFVFLKILFVVLLFYDVLIIVDLSVRNILNIFSVGFFNLSDGFVCISVDLVFIQRRFLKLEFLLVEIEVILVEIMYMIWVECSFLKLFYFLVFRKGFFSLFYLLWLFLFV